MRLIFLGTGTSFGIPVIGCGCATCTSEDPRDRRTRHGALVEGDRGERLLVDTPPELRLQLLAAGIDRVDGVWFTHDHADHVHGIDDLRAFSARMGRPLDTYAGEECARALRERFGYIFDPGYRVPRGTTRPEIRLETVRPGEAVEAAGLRVLPLRVPHGDRPSVGFRVGGLGYVVDAKRLPPETLEALDGVRILVLNALWWGRPHPTHFNIEEAVEAAHEVGAELTYLTHLTHRVRHSELAAALPDDVRPAHDGMVVEI